ncbi:MAG: C4-dicarboxylate ABC transporter [Cellvibrionaceae bacterium]|nr:C4-dicarboxylate ABC transporter [Cellvibrionaceae bacterium]|tara:strand:- start:1387 stop:2799 length:1413 start_codon:yes stop_codon:yes gene_type:complete
MIEPSAIVLLPPLLAILLALISRQVYLSLAAGIWMGYTLLANGSTLSGLANAIDGVIAVLQSPGDARVIVFTLVIGGLIATLEASGGVRGFVSWLEARRWVNNAKRSQWLAWGTGLIIFIESNITVLVAGTVSRPLFDRYKVSREKLAYLIDSTSAPICILIPLNAWGAFNLGLLNGVGVDHPLSVFLWAIPLNFYAISAVLMSLAVVVFDWNIGPMKTAEARAARGEHLSPGATPMMDDQLLNQTLSTGIRPRALNMILPIAVLVAAMPLGLWITGDGDLLKGSGSTSVLWAVLLAVATAWFLQLLQRQLSLTQLTDIFLKGAGGIVPLAIILLLALALGDVSQLLKTGEYVAGLLGDTVAPSLLLPLLFIIAAVIAFSVGSSWGTFAIMIPIAVPVAQALGLPVAPFVAAVLSGGIFGDHASPISDTTVVSSMAAATDHIDHVRTQLPYALLAGLISLLAFGVVGMTL